MKLIVRAPQVHSLLLRTMAERSVTELNQKITSRINLVLANHDCRCLYSLCALLLLIGWFRQSLRKTANALLK